MIPIVQASVTEASPMRIGAVSYLNTLPLVEGLGKCRDAALTLTAPARLIDLLLEDEIDIGLVSLIDAQRSPEPLAVLAVGMIGCDGPTLTVRLFSSVALERLTTVHVDADSHTSVALLRVILSRRHGLRPSVVGFDADAHRASLARAAEGAPPSASWPEALLMIGDKVVTDSPPAILYPHQLDLGEAWKQMTGLPFVYAAWMCRAEDADRSRVALAAEILDRQRRHNATRLEWIVRARSPSRGWPAELAGHYLGSLLRFEVDPQSRRAVEVFFDMCAAEGVIERRREVAWLGRAGGEP